MFGISIYFVHYSRFAQKGLILFIVEIEFSMVFKHRKRENAILGSQKVQNDATIYSGNPIVSDR